jgi:hypothetical protein
MDDPHTPTTAGGGLTWWVWWCHHQRSLEVPTLARDHKMQWGLHREHLHITRNSPEVILRVGGRPRQLAVARSVLGSLALTARGYGGRPMMWTSKTDVSWCPQALYEVAIVQRSVEWRCGECGSELRFWCCFQQDLSMGSTIYRDFCTIS